MVQRNTLVVTTCTLLWTRGYLKRFMRHYKPARMIEVGCGFSTLVSARVNREYFDSQIHLTCIEPYPRSFLTDGIEGVDDVVVQKIQDVPLEFFESLTSNDILFIDTSHTVKTGGDVTWIFHEILPRLSTGVIVHIHDFYLPGEYPEPWGFGRLGVERDLLGSIVFDVQRSL